MWRRFCAWLAVERRRARVNRLERELATIMALRAYDQVTEAAVKEELARERIKLSLTKQQGGV